ncbi:MAG: Fur family transcriptional regulator, ferric uptake regulator [Deferribacteres bacterium]|jgi:Fur family ferric uptake transcriptional regulator|nr:transcriptional repressor [Deferribacteraceae bacterium]MDK2792086.1 Fur family transcriptional regulator, ferric uptake regulator [Deferribacteres bacterium]
MESLKKLLHNKNIRITKNKKQLLEFLIKASGPVSAVEIIHYLSKFTNINKSTVYRIMDEFVSKNLVRKFVNENGESMYCPVYETEGVHAHLHCSRCDTYFCKNLDENSLSYRFDDFKQVSVSLLFNGICEKCNGR